MSRIPKLVNQKQYIQYHRQKLQSSESCEHIDQVPAGSKYCTMVDTVLQDTVYNFNQRYLLSWLVWLSWLGVIQQTKKTACLISWLGHMPGWQVQSSPWLGRRRSNQMIFISPINASLLLSLPDFPSLKINTFKTRFMFFLFPHMENVKT